MIFFFSFFGGVIKAWLAVESSELKRDFLCHLFGKFGEWCAKCLCQHLKLSDEKEMP